METPTDPAHPILPTLDPGRVNTYETKVFLFLSVSQQKLGEERLLTVSGLWELYT